MKIRSARRGAEEGKEEGEEEGEEEEEEDRGMCFSTKAPSEEVAAARSTFLILERSLTSAGCMRGWLSRIL